MKRIWFPYTQWEDFKNGLYSTKKHDNEDELRECIVKFFKSKTDFIETGMRVFKKWPNSINFNLSYSGSNRRSYLGQVACCYRFGASAKLTASVWSEMDKDTQDFSNSVADNLIEIYEKYYFDKNHKSIVRGKNENLS